MTGWWISVDRGDPQEPRRLHDREGKPALGQWECRAHELGWLHDLTRSGRAVQTINRHGYPDIYAVRSEDLPAGKNAIPPGETLRVEVWDLS